MAGFLTPAGKAYLLNALVGKGASARSVYLGLSEGLPLDGDITLATITEPSDAGYARAAVEWNSSVIDGLSVSIKNSNEETLGTAVADMNAASYAFLASTAGTTGDLLYVWELAEPVSALAGKPIIVPAQALVIE